MIDLNRIQSDKKWYFQPMNPKLFALTFGLVFSLLSQAQTNETPENLYQWKSKNKTALQPGYVVLRSGKRLEGEIALKGSYHAVEEVEFVGDGKEISFPVAALSTYGLHAKPTQGKIEAQGGIVNDSPESLFEWNNGGIVMDKVVTNSTPREGYVVTKGGKKVEGMLRVQKRDDELWNFQIKNGKEKQKFKAGEISRYGLSVSASEIDQANLAKVDVAFYPGTVVSDRELSGQVGLVRSTFKVEKVILEMVDGTRSEHTPDHTKSFRVTVDGQQRSYIPVEGFFIWEEYNGDIFQLYRNPKPTTINQFATGLVKTGVEAGTQAAAEGMVRQDAKKNNYVTNLDSVIRVSSKDELIGLRDKLLQLGGYTTVDEMEQYSDNESLNNTVNAIELAIAGKELAESDEGIYNKEWVILNKKTGDKTIVYRSDYKKLIEPLLYGCYEYLSLDKAAQKEHQKWKNLNTTVAFLDSCY